MGGLAAFPILAFIVPIEGAILSDKEILSYCKGNLPPFKVSHKVRFSDRLPKTDSGKVMKHKLE
jgi:long-chain acyl-CoA synthetase